MKRFSPILFGLLLAGLMVLACQFHLGESIRWTPGWMAGAGYQNGQEAIHLYSEYSPAFGSALQRLLGELGGFWIDWSVK